MAAAEWHREKVLAFSRCFFVGSSRKVGEANKGLGEAPKSCTRKEHESATNPIAKRGQGGDFVPFRLPLAGSRGSAPCGVWGNAPTVSRPTNPKEAANKGAGSEASLPLTLRVRRRAPKLLFFQDSVKNPTKSTALPDTQRRAGRCFLYHTITDCLQGRTGRGGSASPPSARPRWAC